MLSFIPVIVSYAIASLFIGTILTKNLSSRTWEFIITKKRPYFEEYLDIICNLIVFYLFWPVVILIIIIFSLFKMIPFGKIGELIIYIDKIMTKKKGE